MQQLLKAREDGGDNASNTIAKSRKLCEEVLRIFALVDGTSS